MIAALNEALNGRRRSFSEQGSQRERRSLRLLVVTDGEQGMHLGIHVDEQDAVVVGGAVTQAQRQPGSQIDCGGGFTHAAFFVCNCDRGRHASQPVFLHKSLGQ